MNSILALITTAILLTGTLAGALEGPGGIATSPEKLDGKLVLTHVVIKYRIKITKDQREATERALQHHAGRRPVSESVKRGITVEWLGEIVEE